jgi:glyoxylase-like metal-dependent hydrolase (beta-lactamase superfamily II)
MTDLETEMSYGSDYHYLPVTSIESGDGHEVRPDILCHTVQIVNVSFIGLPTDDKWVLVDAGMPKSADDIVAATEKRFGANCRPEGIVLTHGHFDHVGAIVELVKHWNVPVYAHELEMPYLTGKQAYSPADPTVEGGLVAKMSPLFPTEPINLGKHVAKLPPDGTIPVMQGWRWIHTPGHTPGHISLFRDNDRSLIAGDAFVTVKQESIYKVFTQEQEISGPPRYLTPDWPSAWKSVRRLESLKPAFAITGHGLPMAGELLTTSLQKLVSEFERISIPDYGKYVH